MELCSNADNYVLLVRFKLDFFKVVEVEVNISISLREPRNLLGLILRYVGSETILTHPTTKSTANAKIPLDFSRLEKDLQDVKYSYQINYNYLVKCFHFGWSKVS